MRPESSYEATGTYRTNSVKLGVIPRLVHAEMDLPSIGSGLFEEDW